MRAREKAGRPVRTSPYESKEIMVACSRMIAGEMAEVIRFETDF